MGNWARDAGLNPGDTITFIPYVKDTDGLWYGRFTNQDGKELPFWGGGCKTREELVSKCPFPVGKPLTFWHAQPEARTCWRTECGPWTTA